MKVAYITMAFPASSETFACTDVRTLQDAGHQVSVHALKPRVPGTTAFLKERGLSSVSITHTTWRTVLRGVALCVARPVLTVQVVFWLLTMWWKHLAQPAGTTKRIGEILSQEYLRNTGLVQLLVSLAFVPRSMAIVAELEREKPDVIHLFWGHYPCIVGFLALKSLPQCVHSIFLGAHDLTRKYAASGWIARRAHLVSTHAAWNVDTIVQLGVRRDRIHVSYRGIDRGCFQPGALKHRFRVVCAGRLETGKGVDDVLVTFRSIRARWPNASLRVIGDGCERIQLERIARSYGITDAVTFVGHIPQRELASELAQAEVFLHMSWEESERLPNVVKEAMASGCICVVSDTDGINELVKDMKSGFVVPKRDTLCAADRIDAIFSRRVDVASMIDMGFQHIAMNFDVVKSMQSYKKQWEAARNRLTAESGRAGQHSLLADASNPAEVVVHADGLTPEGDHRH